MQIHHNEKGQAVTPAPQTFGTEAFAPIVHTEIRWLGSSGALVNSRGTVPAIDPVLSAWQQLIRKRP